MNKKILNISACAFLMGLVACSDDGKTAGVTEDDNAIAQNGSSSSFSGDAEPKFDLWNGADGLAQVNLGDEKVGYWYSFNVPCRWETIILPLWILLWSIARVCAVRSN